jgi:hypothetical protein
MDLEAKIAELEERLGVIEANRTIRINDSAEKSKEVIKIRGKFITLTGGVTEYKLPEAVSFDDADKYEVMLIEEGNGTSFPRRLVEKVDGRRIKIHSDQSNDNGRIGLKITEL